MEWHLHTVIFSLWIGYNYTINAHPRVDSYTETLLYAEERPWIELAGCLMFAIPYIYLMVHYGLDFVATS